MKRFWRSEEGSIEAGLTIIPTTVFFLMVLQIVVSGSFQMIGNMNLQDWVSRKALGQNVLSERMPNSSRPISFEYESLPGGGELVLATASVSTPKLSTLLGVAPVMRSQAIAISE